MESLRQTVTGWHHWFPFAALMVRDAVPQNRPMTTRIIEQAFVATLAGGGGTFATYSAMLQRQEVTQAAQAEQIMSLREQVRDSEIRLTAQIVELRSRQLR